eukprot:295690-Amphidinium_carterae.1
MIKCWSMVQATKHLLHAQVCFLQEVMCDERQGRKNLQRHPAQSIIPRTTPHNGGPQLEMRASADRDVLITMNIHPWYQVLLVNPVKGAQKKWPGHAR